MMGELLPDRTPSSMPSRSSRAHLRRLAAAGLFALCAGGVLAETVLRIPFVGVAEIFLESEDDLTPDPFAFTPVTDLEPGAVASSESALISGIDAPSVVGISGDGVPGFRINGGSLVTVGGSESVVAGDTIAVSLQTAAGVWEASYEAVLTIGGFSATFTATTRAQPHEIAIAQTPLPDAEVGVAWSHDFRGDATVGGGPLADPLEISDLTWSVSAGALPQGLSLNAATGILSGTPTQQEFASFTITATSSETSASVAQEMSVIDYTSAMEMEWDIPNPTATLPLRGTVDVTVDWGSDYANEACQRRFIAPGNHSCTYDAPGLYTVRIAGTLTGFGSGDLTYPNAEKLVAVTTWGETGLTSLAGAFHGAENLAVVPADFPEAVTDISDMFRGAINFNQDLSSWRFKTRNIVAMDRAFQDALAFDGSLETWCTPGIKAPTQGFREAFRAVGPRGAQLGKTMLLTENREPRWGGCGMDLAGGETPAGRIGDPFSYDVGANAALWASAPAGSTLDEVVFAVVQGELPPGLALDPETGQISGTPTTAGSYSYTIRAIHMSRQ
jgi:large repetitive protein